MMAREEESLELRIDVSLDQDKNENQEEIIYSQNSDVDVVNLECDSPPLSSSASRSDGGNMSGPECVELVSPTPPKVFRSASKRFSSLSFAERCHHIINCLHSPETESIHSS